MFETLDPAAGCRLNVDFEPATLAGRGGGALSLSPRRITGLGLPLLAVDGVMFLAKGGEDLPGRRVESVFIRENDGRLSGDVRRDALRESG